VCLFVCRPLLHPIDAAPECSGVDNQHIRYVDSPSVKHNDIDTAETAIEGSPLNIQPDVWVRASEFVPGQPWRGLGKICNQIINFIRMKVR